jgi:DNA mismatch repair ATPase MutS
LVRNPRVISLVATHFEYLSSLADEHPNIANMKVVLEPLRAPGMWHRTYRLAPGVSDQHVALDMLAEKGLEPSIVSKAQEVLRKVEVSMRSSSPAPQNSVK